MILDYFIDGFRARFPERELVVPMAGSIAVVPAAHVDVGDIEVRDDSDELIVTVGEITHSHFACYDNLLSTEVKQQHVANAVLDFMDDIFSNRIEFWGRDTDGGGWRIRSKRVDPSAG